MKLDWSPDPWEVADGAPRTAVDIATAPPGLPFNLVVGATASVMLLWTATPGWMVMHVLATSVVLGILGVVWLVRAVSAIVLSRRGHGRRPAGFMVAPAIVVAMALLVALDVPVRVGFEMSRREMQRLADDVAEGARGADADADRAGLASAPVRGLSIDQRIGRYWITSAVARPTGVLLYERNGSFFDDAGFAYFPDGDVPPGDALIESPDFRSLGGGWYAFTAGW